MSTGPTSGDPMPGPCGGGMLLVAMREVDCCQGWTVVRGVRGREEPHGHRAHIRGSPWLVQCNAYILPPPNCQPVHVPCNFELR